MRDEEVGELWRGVLEAKRHGREWAHPVLHCVNQKEDLIRKLVEERDRSHRDLTQVLLDFGIDPKTWPKE